MSTVSEPPAHNVTVNFTGNSSMKTKLKSPGLNYLCSDHRKFSPFIGKKPLSMGLALFPGPTRSSLAVRNSLCKNFVLQATNEQVLGTRLAWVSVIRILHAVDF